MNNVEDFRINSLIDPIYEGQPINTIDFKRHLRSDIALNKKIVKGNSGRPIKSEYYFNSEKIAEIKFIIQTDSSNLMTRRTEELYYVKKDGSLGDKIIIKDKIYDITNLVDGEAVIAERINARNSIVSSMKAFLSGVLMQATGMDMSQIISTIKPFWDEHKVSRDHFIELGDGEWKTALSNINLTTTPYTFLAIYVDGNGTTVRDYLVLRLSY